MNVIIYIKNSGFIRANLEDVNTVFSPVPPPIIDITSELVFFIKAFKDMTETILTFSFDPELVEILSKAKEFLILSVNEIHVYREIIVSEIGESYISVNSKYKQEIFTGSYKYTSRTRLNKILYEQNK